MTGDTQTRQSTSEVFTHESYLVEKKIMSFSAMAEFHIYDPNGSVAFYSRMELIKFSKLKKDIQIYTDKDMHTEILTIQARQIIDFSAAYDVVDPTTNTKVGALKRKGMKSLLRDEWIIMDEEDREIGHIKEDTLLAGLLRRVSFLASLVPQTYRGELSGQEICQFKQNHNPFVKKINVDFSMDRKGLLDRRLGIAGAVLLCAIEGKQSF